MAGLRITPSQLDDDPKASEVDFGARVTGVDLAKINEEEFRMLEDALYRHLVLAIPNQGHLTASQQLHINKLFDPGAEDYGHGSNISLMKASALQNDLISVASAPQV